MGFIMRSNDMWERLTYINGRIAFDIVPTWLRTLPRAVAVVAWAGFSVIWIGVLGPITFLAEAMLAPMVLWESTEEYSGNAVLRLGNMVVVACMMICFFVYFRFTGCLDALRYYVFGSRFDPAT